MDSSLSINQSPSHSPCHVINITSFPDEVIDRIFFHLLDPTYNDPRERLPDSILSLALTCKSFYDCISHRIANTILRYSIAQDFINSTSLRKQPYPLEDSYRNLLFKAALIALNKLKKNLPASSISQSTNGQASSSNTNLSTSNFIDNIKFILSRSLDSTYDRCSNDFPNPSYYCDLSAPLFCEHGHTRNCRQRLSLLAIAASSGNLKTMDFNAFYKIDGNHELYCALRFLHLLKLPLQAITFNRDYNREIFNDQPFLDLMFQSASFSLRSLDVIISPFTKRALVTTSLPNLRQLALAHYSHDQEYHRQGLRDVLSSLYKHGARIESLELDKQLISSIKKTDHDFIAKCLPDLKHLICDPCIFTQREYFTPDNTSDDQVAGPFYMIESLEIRHINEHLPIPMVTLNKNQKLMLPKLQYLAMNTLTCPDFRNESNRFHHNLFYIPQIRSPLQDQPLSICKFIYQYRGNLEVDHIALQLLERNIAYNIQIVDLPISCAVVDQLESFLLATTQLRALSLRLHEVFDYHASCDFPERFVEIMRLFLNKNHSLTQLSVHGGCISPEDCSEIMKAMGRNTRVFRFPLTIDYDRVRLGSIVRFPTYQQVISVLDTVAEYLPNIEELCFTTRDTICDWEDAHIEVVKNYVLRVASRLERFRVGSFLDHWPPRGG